MKPEAAAGYPVNIVKYLIRKMLQKQIKILMIQQTM
jgi:hypothetical protein